MYQFHSTLYKGSRDVKPISKACRKLRDDLMGKWAHCFKKELEPTDRMRDKQVSLKLKEGYVNPTFCSKPYDTPYHLRTMHEKEIKRGSDAGHLAPCGIKLFNWASKAFPVPKADGSAVMIVADFQHINRHIQRPVWPTESSNQLRRYIDAKICFFATMGITRYQLTRRVKIC